MSKHTIAELNARLTEAEQTIDAIIAKHNRLVERIAALEDAQQPKPQAPSFEFRTALGRALAAASDGTRRAAYFRAHPGASYVSTSDVDIWCAEL